MLAFQCLCAIFSKSLEAEYQGLFYSSGSVSSITDSVFTVGVETNGTVLRGGVESAQPDLELDL